MAHLNLPDDALQPYWHRLLRGEREAMTPLMQALFRPLFHYGSKFSTNPESVKDCIQDVFLQIWERRANLDPTIPVRAYLMASLRRRLHQTTLQAQPFRSILPDEDALFDVEFNVQDALIADETTRHLAQHLKRLLEALPKRQQEVVYLRFFQDLSREQTAEVMDVAPQSVSNLLQQALTKLRHHATDLTLLVVLGGWFFS